ncbi:MAG: oligosaccharide flippase family protein, partial [Planctomycetota bacterium]
MQGNNEAKYRLLPNISTNFIAIVLSVLIGFWLTRYLIQHLGVAAYGTIPLVTQVVSYLDLFSMAIRNAVGRFVAIHFNRQENDQSNIYFNTALFSVMILCLLLCIPVIVITTLLTFIFNIPEGHETDARWLFLLVTLSSFFLAITSPFLVSTLIRHRFDLSNLVRILSKLFRVAILVLCFRYLRVSLGYVGWSYFGMSSFLLFSSMWLTRRLTPQLRIRLKSFRWYAFRKMAGMSTWMTINQIGTLLYLSTDLIIINLLLGSEQCGRYGPLVLLVSLLSMLGTAIANVFTPIVYEYIAQKKEDALARHAKRSTKFMGLVIALPIGLICGFSTPMLTRWLGTSFADLSPLTWLLVIPCIINITVRPLFSIYRGMNKVKVPAIVILAGGVINVLLSIFLIKYAGLGLYGAALASVFCLTSKNLFFTPIYVALQLGQAKYTFFKDMFPGILMAALLSSAGFGLSRMYDLSSLLRLFVAALPLGIIYLFICYWIGINKEDRLFLL